MNVGLWSTSGSGNIWDASSVQWDGNLRGFLYHDPGSSPFAALYPQATLSAQQLPGPIWYHYRVDNDRVELIGTDGDEWVDGRTLAEFPFELGDSFTDQATIVGIPWTETREYVASGELVTPWGVIPDVVMVYVNGNVYELYTADDILEPIGNYNMGGAGIWKVDDITGTKDLEELVLGIWPSPARVLATVSLPFSGPVEVQMIDQTGRVLWSDRVMGPTCEIPVAGVQQGVYTVVAVDCLGRSTTGRLVVALQD
ncbi:MAG: hypothetical protein JNL05_07480 [Flavobacteriales bacterium]|nr:hypothetical protein [Flavobacteriales bacterium]